QSFPAVILRGDVHPDAVRSANFSVVVGPLRSIQLRMTPLSVAVSCGSLALPAAGDAIARTVGGHGGADRPHAIDTSTTAPATHTRTLRTDKIPSLKGVVH